MKVDFQPAEDPGHSGVGRNVRSSPRRSVISGNIRMSLQPRNGAVLTDGGDGVRAGDGAWRLSYGAGSTRSERRQIVRRIKPAGVLSLTKDSQIGANLRVCADEENRADFDQCC
jgi:hypothetical protein